MTDAPDENSMIASLLEDAARAAAAANEKLAEALAIAERDAAFNADRQWFKSRPDRSFRARLATAQDEVADMMACTRADQPRRVGALDRRL